MRRPANIRDRSREQVWVFEYGERKLMNQGVCIANVGEG
jgi:hypothetical protein